MIKYKDNTNPNNQELAWEVNGSGKDDKKVEKVVQIKVGQDPNDKNVDVMTKTTYLRNNVID